MESHPSLTLSSVHLPADSINQLKKDFEKVQEVHLPRDDVSSVRPAGSNNLLVVHLPDTHGSGHVENKLKENGTVFIWTVTTLVINEQRHNCS
jgi:hypothetical protein